MVDINYKPWLGLLQNTEICKTNCNFFVATSHFYPVSVHRGNCDIDFML